MSNIFSLNFIYIMLLISGFNYFPVEKYVNSANFIPCGWLALSLKNLKIFLFTFHFVQFQHNSSNHKFICLHPNWWMFHFLKNLWICFFNLKFPGIISSSSYFLHFFFCPLFLEIHLNGLKSLILFSLYLNLTLFSISLSVWDTFCLITAVISLGTFILCYV